MKKITIKGKEYPSRITLGAMLRFKEQQGYDVSQIKDDISDVVMFLYQCVVSACRADEVEFPYGIEEFADNLSVEILQEFQNSQKKTKTQALATKP